MTVYADILFAVNAAVDYLLLRAAAALCADPMPRRRALLAAVIGGGAALCELLPASFFHTVWHKLLTFLLMVIAAFGFRRRALRPAVLTLLCTAALAGLLLVLRRLLTLPLVILRGTVYYPVTARVLIFVSGLCYFLSALCFSGALRHGKGELIPLTLRAGGRKVAVTSLYDTGNALRDPMTGRAVAVLTKSRFCELCGIAPSLLPGGDAAAALRRLCELCPSERFLLVPYRTVGTADGLLPCVCCTALIGRRRKPVRLLAALSPTPMAQDGYEALIGGQIV